MGKRPFTHENNIFQLHLGLPLDGITYLASPYSHPDKRIREWRFDAACYATARMIQCGYHVFSPVAHSHPLVRMGAGTSWEYWEKFDRWMIESCKGFAVLMLDGWEESKGVQAEILIAENLHRRIMHIMQWFTATHEAKPAYGLEPSPRETEQSLQGPSGVACEERQCCDTSEGHVDSLQQDAETKQSQHRGESKK